MDGPWARLHTAPKQCGRILFAEMTARQKYYYLRSFERWHQTEDGKYLASLQPLKPEIGRIDDVRLIVTKYLPPEHIKLTPHRTWKPKRYFSD